MFSSILKTDFMDKVKEQAKKTKITDYRNKFKKMFENVENYVKENNIIISDIDMLMDENDNKILYKEKYNIYCSNPFKHGNNLINFIAENMTDSSDLSKWLVLRTAIPHRLLNITYKGVEFVRIHCLYSQKIEKLNLIIKPVSCKGFYIEENIYILPYEIELIDIYRKLYMPNPECVLKWKELLAIEPYLVSETNNRIKNKIFTETVGGKSINIESETIKQIIIFKMLSDSNFILIGEWAIKIIEWGLTGGSLRKSSEKIQIISETEINKTFDDIKNHIKTILPSGPYEITYREHELHIPKDLRIRRYTIYIQIPCNEENECPVKQITIMDIFTNASYELVPWISSNRFLKKKNNTYPNIKIGNPYVLLRFFMLDLWILRIIFSKKMLIQSVVQKKIDNIWISINKIRNPNKLGGIINKSFSLENYIGKYYSEMIYFKTLIKNQKNPDYFPYKWKKEMKSYRDIFTKYK